MLTKRWILVIPFIILFGAIVQAIFYFETDKPRSFLYICAIIILLFFLYLDWKKAKSNT